MSRVIRADAANRGEPDRAITRARQEATRIIEDAKADAARLLMEASRARDMALISVERDAQALALEAARHIVGEAIALEPDRVEAIVRSALLRARRTHPCEVHVHPDDVAALERARLEPSVQIVSDASIARGGCIVRNPLGTIDARVEVRLDAIAHWLAGETP